MAKKSPEQSRPAWPQHLNLAGPTVNRRFFQSRLALRREAWHRTTSRERVTYHLREAYGPEALAETPAEYKIQQSFPERESPAGGRLAPPVEHSVLVGWYENAAEANLRWIRASGLYNFRAGDRNGSIRLEQRIAGAKHLLLHTHGGHAHPGLWRIKRNGPRLFTAEELLRCGYPPELKPRADAIYAVYDVEPDEAYAGWKWTYANLGGRKGGHQSAQPFAANLADVLAMHTA